MTFAWAGSDAPGRGHYYAVRGPTFVIEYDNTQNGANHIHAVWRDLESDWGEDVLAGAPGRGPQGPTRDIRGLSAERRGRRAIRPVRGQTGWASRP